MKIALIGRDAHRVLAFRGSLARLAQREGHEVIAITGPAAGDEVLGLVQAGIRWFSAPLDAGGLNPLADLAYRRAVERILRAEGVDAVLAYNPKCLAHGPIAARRAGVRVVVGMVTGLGHGFVGAGIRERFVRRVKARLYRRAFAACDRVLVQNAEDLAELGRCGAVRGVDAARIGLIAGSGVDLERFAMTPPPTGAHFLMISRPLREKGLPEFFEAAHVARRAAPHATFTWLGPMEDANPSAVDRATLERWLADGDVRHLPECADVRPAIEACSVFVLPSHREGTSKVMLEAMAMGRSIVTTDAAGCGHLVDAGRCGRAVPVADPRALAHALVACANDPAWRETAGAAARVHAERRFDARVVDRTVLDAMLAACPDTLRS